MTPIEEPRWVSVINSATPTRVSFERTISERIELLTRQVTTEASDFNDVLLARGGLRELQLLRRLLTNKEREDEQRRRYDARTRPAVPPG